MKEINYKSDFKIAEVHDESLLTAPFKFTYYVEGNTAKHIVSYDGATFYNCRREEGRLIIPFKAKSLGPGPVNVIREFFLTDSDFRDGICNIYSSETTDIYLGDGYTDCEGNVEMELFPYYQQGRAGKDAYQEWLDLGNSGSVYDFVNYLRGKPFTYEDFTPAQLEALKGPKGDKGDKMTYDDLSEDEKNDIASRVEVEVPEEVLSEYAKKSDVPTKTSELTNDSGFLTEHQDISGKQDTLISGNNIKTINNESLLGSGNIEIKSEEAFPLKTITQNIIGLDSNNANLSGYYGTLESFGIKSGDIKLESLTVYRRAGNAQGNYIVRCKVLGVKNGSWYLIAKSSNTENISAKTIAGEPIKFNLVMEENIPVLSSKDTIGIIFSNQEISSSNLGHGVIVSLKTIAGINGGINKGADFNGTIDPNPSIYNYSPAISFKYYSYNNDDSVVHLDKDETINSVKTFNKKEIFNDGISIANKTLISSGIDSGELKVFPQGSNNTKGFIVRSANRGDTIPTVELLATNTQASYTYSFPKKSGTVALLTDIPNTYTKTEIENMIAEAVVSTINSSY